MIAKTVKVEEFLSTNKTQFVIPLYQRNYSWEKEHCKQLLDDILEVGHDTEENRAYFIGSIVYVKENKNSTISGTQKYVIVDGQQRLTTLTLIYIVLYRKAKALHNKHLANEIYETYLINKFSKDSDKIKLKPIEGDDAALEHLLSGKDSKDYRPFSRIINAFDYFDSHITDENFHAVQNGVSKLMFVDIALNRNHDDPQKIFESLNSTGLNLSQADLIRNYILMGRSIDEQNELYKDYWEVIERYAKHEEGDEKVNGKDEEGYKKVNAKVNASAFIRDYLTLQYKEIPNKGKVYLEFKKKYPQKEFEQLKKDLAEMVRFVKLYHKLINPEKEENKDIRTELQYARRIDVSVAYPFLMKVYDDYENEQCIDKRTFIAVLQLIQSFMFRRLIVGVSGAAASNVFKSFYEKVNTDQYLYSIQEDLIQRKGLARFPDDKEVRDVLKETDVYSMKQKNKNYLFERLENHENEERVVIDERITIEHIFPQKPNQVWIKELGKEACRRIQKDYLHTIGNLTLSSNNSTTLRNKSFQEKQSGYKDSPLWLNKTLADADLRQWNEETIKRRCEQLTKRFVKVWSYPKIKINYEDEVDIFEVDEATDKKPEYIIFMDEKTEHKDMKSVYVKILQKLSDIKPELFSDEYKGMRKRIQLEEDRTNLYRPSLIKYPYYVETSPKNNTILQRIKHALAVFDLEDKLTVKFK